MFVRGQNEVQVTGPVDEVTEEIAAAVHRSF